MATVVKILICNQFIISLGVPTARLNHTYAASFFGRHHIPSEHCRCRSASAQIIQVTVTLKLRARKLFLRKTGLIAVHHGKAILRIIRKCIYDIAGYKLFALAIYLLAVSYF